MSALAELDAEYHLDAGAGPVQTPPMLAPYWGEEGPSRDWVLAQQRRAIRQWISRNALFAAARREIDARYALALAAEGLA